MNLRETFNKAVQAGKDTINGFEFKSFLGWLHAGATGYMTWQTITLALAIGLSGSTVISGLFAGVGLYSAWNNGRHMRLAGYPPRYIS